MYIVQQPKNDFFSHFFLLLSAFVTISWLAQRVGSLYSIKYLCTAYFVLIIEHVLKLLVIFYYTNNITVIISFTQNHCGYPPHSLLIYKYHYITALCAARFCRPYCGNGMVFTRCTQNPSRSRVVRTRPTTTNSFIQRYNRKLIGINVYFNLLPICAICCKLYAAC